MFIADGNNPHDQTPYPGPSDGNPDVQMVYYNPNTDADQQMYASGPSDPNQYYAHQGQMPVYHAPANYTVPGSHIYAVPNYYAQDGYYAVNDQYLPPVMSVN